MDAERELMETFICCYESHRALWDVTSKEYLVREKKDAGYQELLQILKKIKSNATKDDVRRKINSLRSSYRRELKKTKESETSGAGTDNLYESTIWWFPLMSFLHHLEKPVNSLTSMDEELTSPEILESEVDEDAGIKLKKKKTTKQDGMLSTAWSYLTQPEDTFDKMAKTWADKLRKMRRNQSIIAEKIINDTIFEGELGFLTFETIAQRNCSGSTSTTNHSPFTVLPSSPSPNTNSSFSYLQHTSHPSHSTSTLPVPSPSQNSEPEVQTLSPTPNFVFRQKHTIGKRKFTESTATTSHSPYTVLPSSPSPNTNSSFSYLQYTSHSPNPTSTMPVRSPSLNSEPEVQTLSPTPNLDIRQKHAIAKRNCTLSTAPTSHSPYTILPSSPSPNTNSSFSYLQHKSHTTSTIRVPSSSQNLEPEVQTLAPTPNFIFRQKYTIGKRNFTESTATTSHSPYTVLPSSPSPNSNSSFSYLQHTSHPTSTIPVQSPSPNSEPEVEIVSPTDFVIDRQPKHQKLRLIASTSPNQIIYKTKQSKSPQPFDNSQHILIEEQKTEDLRSYVENFTYD